MEIALMVVSKTRMQTHRENDGAYPAPRSGEEGPLEGRWRGAPTTTLRVVPLPRLHGGG
jgi:hypothetical protein